MVIEAIPRGVIPFKCEYCGTVYLWKPMIDDEATQCPVCRTKYFQERISSFRYKMIRAFSKRVGRGGDIS